jgi:hypothetical protein
MQDTVTKTHSGDKGMFEKAFDVQAGGVRKPAL